MQTTAQGRQAERARIAQLPPALVTYEAMWARRLDMYQAKLPCCWGTPGAAGFVNLPLRPMPKTVTCKDCGREYRAVYTPAELR